MTKTAYQLRLIQCKKCIVILHYLSIVKLMYLGWYIMCISKYLCICVVDMKICSTIEEWINWFGESWYHEVFYFSFLFRGSASSRRFIYTISIYIGIHIMYIGTHINVYIQMHIILYKQYNIFDNKINDLKMFIDKHNIQFVSVITKLVI